ncbi:MAG: glycosyltransferase, partial [Balneolaceae bacterium]|nr:glycosyltransferase [Balneolaceae bacterium]
MKVLHIVGGDLDEGASQGAYILHEHLLAQGVDSLILTNSSNTEGYQKAYSIADGILGRIKASLRMKFDNTHKLFHNKNNLKFSSGFFGYDITKSNLFQKADIIHLHWICNGFVDIKNLQKIKKPIVWTLRDMWAMTGGCHYSLDCKRFQDKCGRCPHLDSQWERDISTILQSRKNNVYSRSIQFVGISNWITNQAKKSRLLRDYKITTISNNIDLINFFPYGKEQARKNLNLPSDKPILLFGAQYVNSEYKGYNILLKLLTQIDFEARVVFFGRNSPSKINNSNIECTHLGYLTKQELQQAYSAADLFISTSKMEAFGKTVAESMACGTPVV